jgi:hypothetical protein
MIKLQVARYSLYFIGDPNILIVGENRKKE